jgi:hypothetical protein
LGVVEGLGLDKQATLLVMISGGAKGPTAPIFLARWWYR